MEDDFWVMPEPKKMPLSAEARRRRKRIAVFAILALVLLAYPIAEYIVIRPSPMPFLRLKLMGVDKVAISCWGGSATLRGEDAQRLVQAIDAERGIETPSSTPGPMYTLRFYRGGNEVCRLWMDNWCSIVWEDTRWASGMRLTRDSTFAVHKVFEDNGVRIHAWNDPSLNRYAPE